MRIFTALEKQGVLVSYYSQKGYSLPDFSMERLKELWSMKADYMSWKPTAAEKEKDSKRGFWGKIGKAINPMTHISSLGNKIQSRDYKKTVEEYNLKKVFFNPDYVLIKKYQNWVTANRNRGGIYDVVGLRMEQSPFNYIPMVGIDSAAWSKDLLIQAFNADAFQVGVKEMMFFREQVKLAKGQIENSMKETDKMVRFLKGDFIDHSKEVLNALDRIVEAYQIDPDREHKDLLKECRKAFGWRWNKRNGDPTPKNIIKVYSGDIEQALMYEPLSVAQKAADAVLLVSAIKTNLDTAKMMRELGDEKTQLLQDFSSEFTHFDFAKYLKEGTFLDVKGKTFMDWLADIYPAYEEMEKYTDLYMDEVREYTSSADEANSGTRERWYWFDEKDMHPKTLVKDLNNQLAAFKEVSRKYEGLISDFDALAAQDPTGVNTGFQMPLAESSDTGLHENVYADYEVVCEPEGLDLDEGIEVSPIIPE